jgi:hypothetical protein
MAFAMLRLVFLVTHFISFHRGLRDDVISCV